MSDGDEFLIGIRLREGLNADDYKLVDFQLHVGDLAVVETANGTAIGEVRRPSRPLPEFRRDRLYRRPAPGHRARGAWRTTTRDRELAASRRSSVWRASAGSR